jgi:branched-chain amino acid transport system substrate-binding protein
MVGEMPKSTLPEKIAVGISISLSGKFCPQGEQALRGVQLWVAYANQKGGIYLEQRAQSFPVELIAYDDRSKMDRAKGNVIRLLKEDRVDILLGPYSSVLTMAVAPIAESQKKILWNHGGASDTIGKHGWRYLVNVLSPASSYLRSLPSYLTMREPPLRQLLCLTASSGTFAAHVAHGLVEAAKSRDLTVGQLPFNSPIRDARGIIKRGLTYHPDLLVGIGSFEDDVKLVRHSIGMKPMVTVAAGVAAFGQKLGMKAEGVIGPSQWEPGVHYSALKGANSEWFSAHFKKNFGAPPDYTAAQGFATGVVIQEAIMRAGGLEDERLRQAVADLNIHTFYGAFRIDPKSGSQIGHRTLLVQWKKGEKVVIWAPEAQ